MLKNFLECEILVKLYFSIFLYFAGRIECVTLVKLSVPPYKFIGDEAALTCRYDLENEELYSVKWYKDGNEFYRYIPGERDQKVTIFNMPGVRVDVSIFAQLTISTFMSVFPSACSSSLSLKTSLNSC